MSIKQLDFLEKQAFTALDFLAAGNTEEVITIVQALIPLITEEKRKVAGDGKTWYNYVCSECSLKCKGQYKFIPNSAILTICRLDGKNTAKFEQKEIVVETE